MIPTPAQLQAAQDVYDHIGWCAEFSILIAAVCGFFYLLWELSKAAFSWIKGRFEK